MKAAAALSPDVGAQRALEQAGVRLSVDNLGSYPFVADAEERGALRIHGVIFDIAEGALRVLDRETGQFTAVAVDL